MAKVTMRRNRGPGDATAAPSPCSAPAWNDAPAQSAEDTLARFIASIPNFQVEDLGMRNTSGIAAEQFMVTFGVPANKAQIRVLDVADEWDLAELAGEASKSEQWMMMAKAAASVIAINEAPCLPGRAGYS